MQQERGSRWFKNHQTIMKTALVYFGSCCMSPSSGRPPGSVVARGGRLSGGSGTGAESGKGFEAVCLCVGSLAGDVVSCSGLEACAVGPFGGAGAGSAESSVTELGLFHILSWPLPGMGRSSSNWAHLMKYSAVLVASLASCLSYANAGTCPALCMFG